MSFFAKTGKFATGTTDGANVVVSLGFTPVVIIFWGTLGVEGAAANADIMFGAIAPQTGTDGSSVSTSAQDAVATTDTYRTWATNELKLLDGVGAADEYNIQFVSFDVDGFTVDITDAPAVTSRDVFYLALGGTEVEADYVEENVPVAAGDQTWTTTLTNPNFLLMWGGQQQTLSGTVSNSNSINLGMASKDPLAQFTMSEASSDNIGATDSYRYATDQRIYASITTGGVIAADTELTAWNTNSVTVNWKKVGTHAGNDIFLMFIKCPYAAVINDIIINSGTTQSVVGADARPAAIFIMSHGTTESVVDTSQVTGIIEIGAATAPAENQAAWYGDLDAADPTQADSYQETGKCLVNRTAGTVAADGDLTLAQFLPTGAIFTKTAPAANIFASFAFFSGAGSAGGGSSAGRLPRKRRTVMFGY